MKAAYQGDGATDATTVFGKTFAVGESVDVSDLHPDHQALLVGHPLFKTAGKAAQAEAEAVED